MVTKPMFNKKMGIKTDKQVANTQKPKKPLLPVD
jgi:hypothetical protein